MEDEKITKKCFKCGETKPLSAFYKHKEMMDGHLGKCKVCTRLDAKKQELKNLSKEGWHDKEKSRHRDKYYRLGYKEKHKPTSEKKKEITRKHREKYPEKYKAKSNSQRITRLSDHFHHWSYNKEHYKDGLHLTVRDHMRLHRFISYDQERFMYRASVDLGRFKQGELLDTKDRHEEFYKETLLMPF